MGKWIVMTSLLFIAACSSSHSGSFDERGFKSDLKTWESVKGVVVSDNGGSIWVGVVDNGGNRDGYAASVCELAREYAKGDPGSKTITIIDAPKMAIQKKRVELGKNHCTF